MGYMMSILGDLMILCRFGNFRVTLDAEMNAFIERDSARL